MSPQENDPSEASRHFNHACYHGLFDQALALMAQGADPLWNGESGKLGIHFAAMAGHAPLCALLAQEHPQTLHAKDQAGMTPLHLACRNARLDAAVALARNGAPLEARDDFGRMPADCCPDPDIRSALARVQIELAIESSAKSALARAIASPSIRNFI